MCLRIGLICDSSSDGVSLVPSLSENNDISPDFLNHSRVIDSAHVSRKAYYVPLLRLITMDKATQAKHRFETELEFVQCLANPYYLHHLALNRFLEEPDFIAYLKYLQYWREPQYAKFLVYPHALYFLDLLQQEDFRKQLKDMGFAEMVHRQQFYHWMHYQQNRLRKISNKESGSDTSGGDT